MKKLELANFTLPTMEKACSCSGCGCHEAPAGPAAEPENPASLEDFACQTLFHVPGMCCPTEAALIRKKLDGMDGVHGLHFDHMRRTVRIGHAPEALEAITRVLESLNMGARTEREQPAEAPALPWKRVLAAGLLALGSEAAEFASGPDWLVLGLALAAILLGGLGTYKNGWIALKNRNLNMNALMSCAATGALLIGHWPEAATVMVLFSLAEMLEERALHRARGAIRELLSLAPEQATVLDEKGEWAQRDAKTIAVGSRVRVRPGERVALDGRILEGASSINQAPITGESLPVDKGPGDAVFAGTINEAGSFEYEVTALAADSTLSRILHAVESAQGGRAPIQRFVDRFAEVYTPLVFGLAVLAGTLPPLLLGGGWLDWIYRALVLLVIACPCALVISTPVTLVSGLAAAARRGILIKGGAFLELGRKISTLALDKTGTLTMGQPRCIDVQGINGVDGEEGLRLAASLAARSDHPVSAAVALAAREKGLSLREISEFAAVPGQGIQGVMDGMVWSLGNHRMVEERGLCSPQLESRIFPLEEAGKSVVLLMNEKGVHALFAVADTLKPSAREAVAEIRALGVTPVMLTGDNAHTARSIATQAGIEHFRAELLPDDKLAAVAELPGRTGMVGDGINDAPALARADIGFAMAAAGSDTAIETADVALMDDDLRKIPVFLRLSAKTHAILTQNIALALGIKTVFFGLTFLGQTTMWMAVFADMGVSLLVLVNGLRLLRA